MGTPVNNSGGWHTYHHRISGRFELPAVRRFRPISTTPPPSRSPLTPSPLRQAGQALRFRLRPDDAAARGAAGRSAPDSDKRARHHRVTDGSVRYGRISDDAFGPGAARRGPARAGAIAPRAREGAPPHAWVQEGGGGGAGCVLRGAACVGAARAAVCAVPSGPAARPSLGHRPRRRALPSLGHRSAALGIQP